MSLLKQHEAWVLHTVITCSVNYRSTELAAILYVADGLMKTPMTQEELVTGARSLLARGLLHVNNGSLAPSASALALLSTMSRSGSGYSAIEHWDAYLRTSGTPEGELPAWDVSEADYKQATRDYYNKSWQAAFDAKSVDPSPRPACP